MCSISPLRNSKRAVVHERYPTPLLKAPDASESWRNLLHGVFGSAAQLFTAAKNITTDLAADLVDRAEHIGDLHTADGKKAALLDITTSTATRFAREASAEDGKLSAYSLTGLAA